MSLGLCLFILNCLCVICREGGDIWLSIRLVPNFYDNVFLLVYLTTLGTFILFLLVGSVGKVSKRFNYYLQSTEGVSSVGMYINLSSIVLSL